MGVKISQLPSLASTKVTASDLLPIVNQTDQGTHNITVGTLRTVIENNLSTVAVSGQYSDLLNIPEMFVLEPAQSNLLGGIKVGANLSIAIDGTLSAVPGFQQINVGSVALTQTTSALSFIGQGGLTITADPVANTITFNGSGAGGGGGSGGGGSGNVGNGTKGTLAVYYNTTTVTGTNITFDGNNLGVQGILTAPDIITTKLTATTITSSGDLAIAPGGNLDLTNKRILNLASPQSAGDAANKSYVDGQKAFGKIVVAGQSLVTASSNTDSITFVGGNNVQLFTNPTNRSVTIAVNNTLSFALLPASTTTIGGIIVGSGLSIDPSGVLSNTAVVSISTATTTTAGTVIVGSGLSISSAGTLTALAQVLTTATANTLGGVKIGAGVIITSDGTIEVPQQNLLTATSFLLGGVKIGSGISAAVDGTISVSANGLPVATTATAGVIKVGYGLSATSDGTLNLGANGNFTVTGSLIVNGSITATSITTTGTGLTIIGSANDLQLQATGQVTSTAPIQITTATASTSPITGALIVGLYGTNSAGVGVAGSIYTGADSNFNGVTVGAGGGSQANNVAVGTNALARNSSGRYITAIGASALQFVQTNDNVGVGYSAGIGLTNGTQNTLLGNYAGSQLQTGQNNIAVGFQAQVGTGNGSNNVVIGANILNNAGSAVNNNILIGSSIQNTVSRAGANTISIGAGSLGSATGTNLVMLGYGAGSALTSASNQVIIGGYAGSSIASAQYNGYVTLSDGVGNLKAQWDGSGNLTNVGSINIQSASGSTSIYTGALVVAGGVGVQGTLTANIISSPSIYSNGSPVVTVATLGSSVTSVQGGTGIGVSTTTGAVLISSSATLQIVTNLGYTTTNQINITNATPSNASTSGALTVTGGVGVGGNLNVAGTVNASNIQVNGSPLNTGFQFAGNFISIATSTQYGTYVATITNVGVTDIQTALTNGVQGLAITGGTPVQFTDTAGNFKIGKQYTILTTGTVGNYTNFTAIGSPTNNVGQQFYATGAGSGAGTAYYQTGNTGSITISSVETIDTVAQRMYNQAGFARIQNIPQLTMTNILTITNTQTSTSSFTGALTVNGGVGINGNVYIGSAATPTSILVNGYPLSTSTVFNGGTITNKMYIQNASTSTAVKTNNALAVDGGIWAGAFYLNGYPLSTSTVWSGGTVSGSVNITNGTTAINTTTGALQVTGGVGVQGAIYATGFFDQGQRPIGVGPTVSVLATTTNQVITSGSFQKVIFNSVNWDTNSNSWKTASGGSGGTGNCWIPTVPGFYQISASVSVPKSSATGVTQLAIYKNGGPYRQGSVIPNSAANSGTVVVSAVVDMLTAGTDYIEIWLYQNTGNSYTLPQSAGGGTYFTGCYLRPYSLDSTF
jgi:hypothetical protein